MRESAGMNVEPRAARVETMPSSQDLSFSDVVVDRRDSDGRPLRLLDIGALHIAAGRMIGIAGPSGAGKSTFIEVVSGMTRPTGGDVSWGDLRLSQLSEGRRDQWRRTNVGIVFQEFHLIAELSVEQNILLPQRFGLFWLQAEILARARDMIGLVGLADPKRSAGLLSRGEQQRVAIARALLHAPSLILADEPTASLDADTGRQVADLLIAEACLLGATLIVVSHDPALLERMDHRLRIVAGRIETP